MMGRTGQFEGKGMYSHRKMQVNIDAQNRNNADPEVMKKKLEKVCIHMPN